MKETADLVKFLIEEYGISVTLVVFLLIVIILLVHDPNRAEQLKANFLYPTFRFFRWAPKKYLGAKIGSTINAFLQHYIGRSVSSVSTHIRTPRVEIRWVSLPTDPIFSQDGTLILCLEDSNDQTKNILLATQAALPHIVLPTLRTRIGNHVSTAIDLVMLQKLTDGMARHAGPIFQRYFLDPKVQAEQRTADMFTKLIEIDSKGIFVFMFIQELTLLGERVFRTGDLSDKTSEIEDFLDFLLTIARRDIGEDIEMEHLSKEFKIGITFVAKTFVAKSRGIGPYLNSVDLDIAKGCDSIYVFGFLPSVKTFNRTIDALEIDNRLVVEKRSNIKIVPDLKTNLSDRVYIAFLSKDLHQVLA